jgi:hypothetical protein
VVGELGEGRRKWEVGCREIEVEVDSEEYIVIDVYLT